MTTNSRGVNQDVFRVSEGFQQDLRFAKEHELAWLLRWALSRISRIKEATREVLHGVMEWESYEEWRGRERGALFLVQINVTSCQTELLTSCQLPSRCFPFPLDSRPRCLSSRPDSSHASPLASRRTLPLIRTHATRLILPLCASHLQYSLDLASDDKPFNLRSRCIRDRASSASLHSVDRWRTSRAGPQ